jgi:hypothetical protein
VSEPRYLFGDDYTYQGYEDNERWSVCKVCEEEFDHFAYNSLICSDCEDKIIKQKRERERE